MHPERRSWLRFETILPVVIETPLGKQRCVARNVSRGGICLEIDEPLPLGSEVQVWFIAPSGTRIGASGVVKNHYTFNYCDRERHRRFRGMGVRFTCFRARGERVLASNLERLDHVLEN